MCYQMRSARFVVGVVLMALAALMATGCGTGAPNVANGGREGPAEPGLGQQLRDGCASVSDNLSMAELDTTYISKFPPELRAAGEKDIRAGNPAVDPRSWTTPPSQLNPGLIPVVSATPAGGQRDYLTSGFHAFSRRE